jgi:hypothetical protein
VEQVRQAFLVEQVRQAFRVGRAGQVRQAFPEEREEQVRQAFRGGRAEQVRQAFREGPVELVHRAFLASAASPVFLVVPGELVLLHRVQPDTWCILLRQVSLVQLRTFF